MYQRVGVSAYKEDLENTQALDRMFDHPHCAFKTIHIGGTNGKGSTSHMLTSVLIESGYKVGLYTSPHLRDFRERIRVNGEKISENAVVSFVDEFRKSNKDAQLQPSFFELTVAMAFDYFRAQQVDFAIIEVGLGGRLDSTNIINPELSVITNIGLDHTHLLGSTYEKIAFEKAGIIKNNTPVVIGESDERTAHVFEAISAEMQAPIQFADQLFNVTPIDRKTLSIDGPISIDSIEMDLKGNYQQNNVKSVLAAIDILRNQGLTIDHRSIIRGLARVTANTGMLGRWQQLSDLPLTICDTGHNREGISMIVKQLSSIDYKKLHFVFGVVNDKNVNGVLELLPKDAVYYFTQAKIDRALPSVELQKIAQQCELRGACYTSVEDAKRAAENNACPDDLIFIGGSTFVVAEVV